MGWQGGPYRALSDWEEQEIARVLHAPIRRATADELAARAGVSRRTIFRTARRIRQQCAEVPCPTLTPRERCNFHAR